MVQFDELRLALEELWPDIKDLSEALGMGAIKSEIEQLERRAAEPGFWDRYGKFTEDFAKDRFS